MLTVNFVTKDIVIGQLHFINNNINEKRYMNEILGLVFLPFYRQHQGHSRFLQDNAPPHRAHATKDWLAKSLISSVPGLPIALT